MSVPASNCPNCGAPVRFLWSGAVQTTCEYCHSILVRTDLDLKKVGVVASLPEDVSPLQIGTEGLYRARPFQIVGRILYAYDMGAWNEWHCIYSDGVSGWLSDAQLDYDVTFLQPSPGPLPAANAIVRGAKLKFGGSEYEVTSVTMARYVGVQGELPFTYWDKKTVLFADMRSENNQFGTLDYSDAVPLLFTGEPVEYNDLHLKNVRQFEGW